MKEVLLGGEALALGAVHAGISAAFAYPGTPSTEITEYLIENKQKFGIEAEWCSNEKTAYEAALGASFAGKRVLVSMKHVGLNVAMDAFVNSAISGVKGGLVIAVADDPGMHSSQNEQDSRYLAEFAKIFVFEPADAQEAYEMAREAFHVSEKFGVPVMVRLVTRLAHAREPVETGNKTKQNPLDTRMHEREWVLLPGNARRQFAKLIGKQSSMLKESASSRFSRISGGQGNAGVICAGNAFNYFMEATGGKMPHYKISTYPIRKKKVEEFASGLEKVIVLEEGWPFIEEKVKAMLCGKGVEVIGRFTESVPMTGELNCEIARKALGIKTDKPIEIRARLSPRPPQPCRGCPHVDLYNALEKAKGNREIMVFGDIGCYTLGALPPFNAIGTCICMGSSVNLARGASIAGANCTVGIIGDSTFAHSGIPPLIEAAKNNNNMTLIILDNSTVAMTGGQETMLEGDPLLRLVRGAGVRMSRIRVLEPLPSNHEKNIGIIREELDYRGLSVIVSRRACIRILKRPIK